jgi:hypothetical protein
LRDALAAFRSSRGHLDGSSIHAPGEARALPTPRSWRLDKGKLPRVLDLAHPDAQEIETAAEPGEWKPAYSPFTVLAGEQVRLLKPSTTLRLHHERDRELGRSANGELFVNEALDAGQRFRTAVLCDSETDASEVETLLRGTTLDLGRSRTATYGAGARVTGVRRLEGPWQELGAPHARGGVLLLMSDYLGRSDTGTADPAALLGELALALGLAREALSGSQTFLSHRVVHGQVGRWQMPRPTHPAVTAGSVIVLPPGLFVDSARLSEVLWRGIGERRAEGFGRIALVQVAEEPIRAGEEVPSVAGVPQVCPLPGDEQMSATIRRWVGISKLRSVMLHDGTALGAQLRPVSASLIARVRQEVRAARSLDGVENFLRSIAGKKAEKDLARVAGGRSFEEGVVAHCKGWETRFGPQIPKGVSASDVEPDVWSLQQHWLDAVLERWRRNVQREAR